VPVRGSGKQDDLENAELDLLLPDADGIIRVWLEESNDSDACFLGLLRRPQSSKLFDR
jgi:hypothetical protein